MHVVAGTTETIQNELKSCLLKVQIRWQITKSVKSMKLGILHGHHERRPCESKWSVGPPAYFKKNNSKPLLEANDKRQYEWTLWVISTSNIVGDSNQNVLVYMASACIALINTYQMAKSLITYTHDGDWQSMRRKKWVYVSLRELLVGEEVVLQTVHGQTCKVTIWLIIVKKSIKYKLIIFKFYWINFKDDANELNLFFIFISWTKHQIVTNCLLEDCNLCHLPLLYVTIYTCHNTAQRSPGVHLQLHWGSHQIQYEQIDIKNMHENRKCHKSMIVFVLRYNHRRFQNTTTEVSCVGSLKKMLETKMIRWFEAIWQQQKNVCVNDMWCTETWIHLQMALRWKHHLKFKNSCSHSQNLVFNFCKQKRTWSDASRINQSDSMVTHKIIILAIRKWSREKQPQGSNGRYNTTSECKVLTSHNLHLQKIKKTCEQWNTIWIQSNIGWHRNLHHVQIMTWPDQWRTELGSMAVTLCKKRAYHYYHKCMIYAQSIII